MQGRTGALADTGYWRTYAALTGLGLVNALYFIKYSPLSSLATLLLLLPVILIPVAVWFLLPSLTKLLQLHRPQRFWIVLIPVLLALTVLTLILSADTTSVNRERALIEGMARLLQGQFPYGGSENMSGLPGLLLITLPFYFTGLLGLLPVAGYLLFVLSIRMLYRDQPEAGILLSLLPVFCLPFLYEFVVHSELFFNMALALFWVVWIAESHTQKRWTGLMLAGVVAGLILSTRGVTLLVLFPAGLYLFQHRLRQAWVVAGGAVLGAIVTLAPLYLMDPQLFRTQGPFAIQMSYIPIPVLLVSLLAAVATTRFSRSLPELLFHLGVILFLLVASLFLLTIVEEGAAATLLADLFDIGYFIFMLPFVVAGMPFPRGTQNTGRS